MNNCDAYKILTKWDILGNLDLLDSYVSDVHRYLEEKCTGYVFEDGSMLYVWDDDRMYVAGPPNVNYWETEDSYVQVNSKIIN